MYPCVCGHDDVRTCATCTASPTLTRCDVCGITGPRKGVLRHFLDNHVYVAVDDARAFSLRTMRDANHPPLPVTWECECGEFESEVWPDLYGHQERAHTTGYTGGLCPHPRQTTVCCGFCEHCMKPARHQTPTGREFFGYHCTICDRELSVTTPPMQPAALFGQLRGGEYHWHSVHVRSPCPATPHTHICTICGSEVAGMAHGQYVHAHIRDHYGVVGGEGTEDVDLQLRCAVCKCVCAYSESLNAVWGSYDSCSPTVHTQPLQLRNALYGQETVMRLDTSTGTGTGAVSGPKGTGAGAQGSVIGTRPLTDTDTDTEGSVMLGTRPLTATDTEVAGIGTHALGDANAHTHIGTCTVAAPSTHTSTSSTFASTHSGDLSVSDRVLLNTALREGVSLDYLMWSPTVFPTAEVTELVLAKRRATATALCADSHTQGELPDMLNTAHQDTVQMLPNTTDLYTAQTTINFTTQHTAQQPSSPTDQHSMGAPSATTDENTVQKLSAPPTEQHSAHSLAPLELLIEHVWSLVLPYLGADDLVRMRRVSTTMRDIAEDALGEVAKLGAKDCWRVLDSATKWVCDSRV